MKCPVCGCEYFYVKNPDNPHKYYQFTCKNGETHFSAEVNEDEVPEITDEIQTHCVQCVWQGEYGKLVD
ncbi:MAG: hypothetical protein JRF47_05415 [Deltaproteobacteria bacterium]|nr:hypothetical protein [Deltaproteobacteria bacterium]